MCSIGGFISDTGIDPELAKRLCDALLHYGQERGTQSSGIWADGILFKRAVHPALLLRQDGAATLFAEPVKVALTHTRQPTCGGTGDAQAQPFTQNRTVTVHNGFFDTDTLKKKWNVQKPSGVDSELITSFVSSYGPQLLHRFIETTDGPSAIAAFHEGQLYLMRSGNPLFYMHFTINNAKTHILAFASTFEMLESALKSVWLMPTTLHPKELIEDRLYTATPKELRRLSKAIKRPVWYRGFRGHVYTGYDSHGWPETDTKVRHIYAKDDKGVKVYKVKSRKRGKKKTSDPFKQLDRMGFEFGSD